MSWTLKMAFTVYQAYLLSRFMLKPSLKGFVMAVAVLIILFIILKPRLYFIIFVLVRPLMDLYSSKPIFPGFNLASILTIILIFVCGALLFQKESLRKVRESLFLRRFNTLFGLFMLCNIMSLINSEYILEKTFLLGFISDSLRLLSTGVALNYAAVCFSEHKQRKWFFSIIIGSSFVPLVIGLLQFLFKTGNAYTGGFNRIYGTFLHPSVFAQYLLLIGFLLIYLKDFCAVRKWQKRRLFLLFVVVIFALFNTFSRGTWIAWIVAFTFFVLARTKFSGKIKFILAVCLFGALFFNQITTRFEDLKDTEAEEMNSLEWRLTLWEKTMNNLMRHPFTGSGQGAFEKTESVMAHNDYLRIAYETGIFGFLSYISLLLYMFIFSLRNLFRGKDQRYNIFKTPACILLSLLVVSFADNLARSTVVIFYYYIVIGSILSFPGKAVVTEDESSNRQQIPVS